MSSVAWMVTFALWGREEGVNGGCPWAENPAEGAGNLFECALGSYTSCSHAKWQLPVGFDAGGAVELVAAGPDWSLVQDKVCGASSSGSGFLLGILVSFGPTGDGAILMLILVVTGAFRSCRGCCSIPGPLQIGQRALFRLRMVFTLVLII